MALQQLLSTDQRRLMLGLKRCEANAWSEVMRGEMLAEMERFGQDDSIKALILTGKGKYYCSGVDFGGAFKPMMPSSMIREAKERNQCLFEGFLKFPKPMFAAVNGPAIGAAVTAASLCDHILASTSATFHTPFKALGITPEGCSSVNFPRKLGESNAKVMLEEGKKISAEEALAMNLVAEVIEPEKLLSRAQEFAEQWVAQGRKRVYDEDPDWLKTLYRVNVEESIALANSFLQKPFLEAQYKFAVSKGKTGPKYIFGAMKLMAPLLGPLSKL